MQTWYDESKEGDAAKWTKPAKAMACLRASLPPAARTIYKYSLGLSDDDKAKPHLVLRALKEHYGASIGVSGERQKFLRLLQKENEDIGSWETRVRNQGAQCEYENFADELMRDQFIAGLVCEPLRVKLIGKGHRHKDSTKVTLREVVEIAKAYEATTFANQLMKTARGTQEQVNFVNKPKRETQPRTPTCSWCSGCHQQPRQQHCPAYGKKCAKCGILGHFARACRGRRKREQTNLVQDDGSDEELFATDVDAEKKPGKKFFAHLQIIEGTQTKIVRAQIDSASTCNTIPTHMMSKLFPYTKISKSKATIYTYGNQTMRPRGQVTFCCDRKGKIHTIDFLVVDVPQGKPPLLSGRDAQILGYLKIQADETHAIDVNTTKATAQTPLKPRQLTKEAVLEQYSDVFKPGRGKPLGVPLHIDMDPSVKPVQAPRRRFPVAKLPEINKELQRLCDDGTITPVIQPTNWLSNILVKEKPTGKLRICIDPSQTINKAILRPKYNIPTIEEKLPLLTKAKVFTVLDVSEAFHTIVLDEESSLLTTFQGPDGRYRYTRMPFGISSGPEEYQRRQHEFLEGLNGIINIADDICNFGCGDTMEEAIEDHDKNLISLLDKCRDKDLRLSAKKLQFKSTSVTFMGHVLTSNGVAPDPSKVTAITEMPRPVDKAGVQRFLGMCQYLSKFSRNLSQVVLPLRDLIKQDSTFIWSDAQENAFNSAKDLITSAPVLRYYDVALPVTLQVDASDNAIGGVLMQEGRPVRFTSHSLNETERNYAQIEKECLAIANCMNKWHQYLFGRNDITVHTDHQPLQTIFKKPLNKAPRRLQRMMLQLQQYSFTVEYRKGKQMHVADTLSRAALNKPSENTQGWEVFLLELATMDCKPSAVTSTMFQRVQQETSKDPVLAPLHEMVMIGWPPERSAVPEMLRPYWSFRDEISVYDKVLLKSHQVIIPACLRPEILTKIHRAHQGPDSSIRRARESLYWPGMQAAIRETCLSCGLCAQYLAERPTEPMQSHEIPTRPWSKISLDLFELDGKDYLVMVDHYSDYFELDTLRSTTARAVLRTIKRNFARHGIPDECISDNGPQFISHEYTQFARDYGFTPITSSPYHSKGNGKAESAVKVAKNILKKSRNEDPYLALLAYRNTPQQGYTYSPAQRLMSRKLRDIIPTVPNELQPRPTSHTRVIQDITTRRARAKLFYDKKTSGSPLKEFSKGDEVYVKPNPANKHKPWVRGWIADKPAPRSCTIQTPSGMIRRNHKQIRKARTNPAIEYSSEEEGIEIEPAAEPISVQVPTAAAAAELTPAQAAETATTPVPVPVLTETLPSTDSTSPGAESLTVPLRRSTRNRRRPSRYKDFIEQ